ncbi:lamin tail domain-containing protein [Actinacidiphila oryziradicis]|jgi:hypothetical protein|uniref:Lamin tail domain-containing protein n=1 Tax=Actinacidiphila oryziradicis TaxID=2571141 RepID=A0A4U0T0M0_9ACTN|nr:lamin tail domain-containing protein [Actinacidiphila oryziradicis]TKA06305.1 lamin tail domain-containing protein [Actinacidiphila oryziradicis]
MTLTAATAMSIAAVGALLTAAPAEAAGSVHLTKIYYDSPGKDTGSNASLNAEYVQIKNTTSKAASLKGWVLVDASSHKYTFGAFSLGAGKTVTVRTGKGSNTTGTKYQNRKWYVWNNTKDKATLKKASGAVADTCAYNNGSVDYTAC